MPGAAMGGGITLFRTLLLSLLYTRYLPVGNPTQNFVTVGAGLQF